MSDSIPVEIRVSGGGKYSSAHFEYYCAECGEELQREGESAALWHPETTEAAGFLGLGSKRSEKQCDHAEQYCEIPKFVMPCRTMTQEQVGSMSEEEEGTE